MNFFSRIQSLKVDIQTPSNITGAPSDAAEKRPQKFDVLPRKGHLAIKSSLKPDNIPEVFSIFIFYLFIFGICTIDLIITRWPVALSPDKLAIFHGLRRKSGGTGSRQLSLLLFQSPGRLRKFGKFNFQTLIVFIY